MWTILLSVILSASVSVAVTLAMADKISKKVLNRVEEMCDLNIEQAELIKKFSISTIEKLVNERR